MVPALRADFRFFYPIRVRYAEVDAQAIVFNSHYLTYLDVAITEYFRQIGLDYAQLAREGQMDMAVVKTTLGFMSPAFFDEVLEVGVRVAAFGNTSYTVDFEIYKSGTDTLVLKAQTIYVNYNPRTRSKELVPDFLRKTVAEFEGRG